MPDTLKMDENLRNDGRLVSTNNGYRMIMQGDGNLVIYNSEHTHPKNAIWASNTCNKFPFIGPYRLIMQSDGNLVIYDLYDRAVWASNTCLKGAKPHRLVMQSDGNLVIYDRDSRATWASNTCR